MSSSVDIFEANLSDDADARDVVTMIDSYSREPTANGAPLAPSVRARLLPGLRAHPGAVIFLARAAHEPVGVAVCFVGFSTFAAGSLLNIHDLAVVPAYAGRGIGRKLLEAAEAFARRQGFSKLTLEVQENNARARALYDKVGFASYELDPATGRAFVMQKRL
jgi:ribosomal protein S18 acetylase RimI-like enzyme